MIYAVIGAGFGDCGKGKVVSSLCLQTKKTLVIRFSGGQQAGHRVVLPDGRNHIFSNFNSGTFQGAHTYWSKFCTMDPVGILNELDLLKEKDADPTLYIDMECPITTPFEKRFNIDHDAKYGHGTCGVGVGQTYQREEDHFHLRARDLLYKNVFINKLELLRKYYDPKHHPASDVIENFIACCNELLSCGHILFADNLTEIIERHNYDDIIFEGSQGLLLDESIGFFPHVTRGNTSTKNILDMMYYMEGDHKNTFPSIFLVTRAYQTRHGSGPMTNEHLPHIIPDNPHEHNSNDGIQGVFRKTILDLDLLRYATNCDSYIRECINRKFIKLVITCLDVIQDSYMFTINGELFEHPCEESFVNNICEHLHISECFLSRSPIIESKIEKFGI